MGFFSRKKTLAELEEESERLSLEVEVSSKKVDLAEREAVIKEIKKQYGPSWKKILGLKGLVDISTLRSFLTTAKEGLRSEASGIKGGHRF